MRRNPRKVRWTKAFRKAAGKEMVIEGALADFERRRNVPVRYDRDLVARTVQAMAKVTVVRRKRERLHYEKRMQPSRLAELQTAAEAAGDRERTITDSQRLLARLREKQQASKQQIRTARVAKTRKVRVTEPRLMEIDA